MGLFSGKPKPEPVRNDKVRELLKLGMKETDAGDRHLFDDETGAEFQQAKAAYSKAASDATPAELRAAHEAMKRHGY